MKHIIKFVISILVLAIFYAPIAPFSKPVLAGCEDQYEPNGYFFLKYFLFSPYVLRQNLLQATICPRGDRDLYQMDVASGNLLRVDLFNLTADYNLSLWDAIERREITYSVKSGNTPESISWIAPNNTTIYILVGPKDYETWSDKPYALWVKTYKQSFNAKQIGFNVHGRTFDYLKIVGPNQYGIETTKEYRFTTGQYYVETTNWWWEGTIYLEFNIIGLGRRSCLIDYLKLPSTVKTTPVTYTEGSGCSGDAGSGSSNRTLYEGLYRVLFNEEDSLIIFGAVKFANDSVQCNNDIVKGIASRKPLFFLSKACLGISLDVVNSVLLKRGMQAQISN